MSNEKEGKNSGGQPGTVEGARQQREADDAAAQNAATSGHRRRKRSVSQVAPGGT